MIVSMFVLESRQMGDIWNCEPQTWWLSISSRLDTISLNFPVYWFEIFQNMTQNPLSQNYVNGLHLYQTQNSVQKTIPKVIIKNSNFVCKWYDFIFT